MRLVSFFFLAIHLAWSLDPSTGGAPSVVLPNKMILHGSAEGDSDVNSFKGVPYATPPLGDLRWKPPIPYVPSQEDVTNGVDATSFGRMCFQPIDGSPYNSTFVGSEDCLFLNVYRPGGSLDGSPLPVAVWIHGGSFVTGSGELYNGTSLAAYGSDLGKEVVVVTLNYRLNVFGFLGSKDLIAADPSGTTGNYGIQDQRLALSWVRENIASFGGDPASITIFGESAGAGSVSSHLSMPSSTPFYDAAVMESGGEDACRGRVSRTRVAEPKDKYDGRWF